MARYLFTLWPFPGHINPNVAVALALRQRGHEVAFYTGPRAARTLSELGFLHFPFRSFDEEALYRRLFSPLTGAGWMDSIATWRLYRDVLRGFVVDTIPCQCADVIPVLDDWRPDVIVCDPSMHGPTLVLHEARRIPVAILSYTVGCMLSGPDAPLWGRGLPPPTTWRRSLRGQVEKVAGRQLTRAFRHAASDIRAHYGLAPLTLSLTDYAGNMPLYLVTSAPELDYSRRDLPAHVHYVGRCAWDRPTDLPPPAWLDELPADRPLVYVTEGTNPQNQPALLQAAARGLGGLPIHVLMTLNADQDPVEVGLADLAPNVQLGLYTAGQGWQSDVLQRADLVITNGGAGSVLATLSAGVPMIVVPSAWDKAENAQRVVEAGAGLRLAPSGCTPASLRRAVRRVLGEPAFRSHARCAAATLGRYSGAARAAELLEGLNATKQVSPRPMLTAQPP